jgi:DNA polymerase I-like protein with 3'-5' exonuclease and polymerase domains
VLKNGGKWNKSNKEMYKADLDVLYKYACADADMTLQLFKVLEPELKKQHLEDFFYNQEEMPLNKVTLDMHGIGLQVDLDYYKNLQTELSKEVRELEVEIHAELKKSYPEMYEKLEEELLDKIVPIKSTGSLFEEMYTLSGYTAVCNPKTGKPTFTKKVIESVLEDHPGNNLLKWRLNKLSTKKFLEEEKDLVREARLNLFKKQKNTEYVINVISNDQLGEILFNHLGEKAIKQTEKGKNKVDESVLEAFGTKYKFVELVLQLRKASKLLSTYVEAALTQNVGGVIHPSWRQFGTTSGRYASREPNYQNLPRDDKRIKKGIVARPGKALVGADYSQLEPRCFAHCSNEKSLIDAYINGEDLYGTIAVDVFKLDCSPNEVKDKYPEKRQVCKVIALAVTYGAKEWKIAKILKTTVQKARKIIKDYFTTYPELEKFMLSCHGKVLSSGRVKNETGRIRHLEDIYSVKGKKDKSSQNLYRSFLNLSVNFPIQSLAASIVNRAMIAMRRKFEEEGIDAHILMQVHDEIVAECNEEDSSKVADVMKDCMENTYTLKVPLVAEPKIGKNLAETK